MAGTRNTRANAATPPPPPDPHAPHEVNLKKPAHWGNQLPQADTAMMQDDFAKMGMTPAKVEELINTPEPVRVDGFAQPMNGGNGEAVEGTGVRPQAPKRKVTKNYKGLVIMKGRGPGKVKDWLLYDPQVDMFEGMPSPPPAIKKFLLYEPGNKRVVLFKPGAGSIALKTTPDCLVDKAVEYTDKGPVIVDLTPEQANTLGIIKSIETGECLMSGAIPDDEDIPTNENDEAEAEAEDDFIRTRPTYKGKGKGRADGRTTRPDMPPPPTKRNRITSERGRDIPAIPPPPGSPEPWSVTKERLDRESAATTAEKPPSPPPKTRSSRRQQHQQPEIEVLTTENAQSSSPKKRRRQPEADAPTSISPPTKRRRATPPQLQPAPEVVPTVESAPPPLKKTRTRRPPPPPRTQPARQGKGTKRGASEIEEIAPPAPKKQRKAGGGGTGVPVVKQEESVAVESPPADELAPPPASKKRKGGGAAESAPKRVRRKDSAIEKAMPVEPPKAKRTRKPSKPAITPALVVDSDE